MSNLYLNGVRVNLQLPPPPGRRTPAPRGLRSNPLDQLVLPGEVLAVEMYRDSDVPQEYNATRPPGTPSCGATLVWTK
jgi:hypothetical protein